MLYAAFLLGLVSSLHCLGMCGPIALALPVAGGGTGRKVLGRLLYNAGRISTYALLGLGMGLFGRGLSFVLSQQQLSVAVGVLLLAFVLLPSALAGRLGGMTPVLRFTSDSARSPITAAKPNDSPSTIACVVFSTAS